MLCNRVGLLDHVTQNQKNGAKMYPGSTLYLSSVIDYRGIEEAHSVLRVDGGMRYSAQLARSNGVGPTITAAAYPRVVRKGALATPVLYMPAYPFQAQTTFEWVEHTFLIRSKERRHRRHPHPQQRREYTSYFWSYVVPAVSMLVTPLYTATFDGWASHQCNLACRRLFQFFVFLGLQFFLPKNFKLSPHTNHFDRPID